MIKALASFWMFIMAAIMVIGLVACAVVVYVSVRLGILTVEAFRTARENRKLSDLPPPPPSYHADAIPVTGREGSSTDVV